MSEQREPGWYWARPQGEPLSPVEWKGYWEGLLGEEPDEIGERIPDNEELIALRAVAEAARAFMYHTVKNASKSKGWPYEEMVTLQDALARLGERK